MIERLKKEGYAQYWDEGALVIDVQEETDTKEVPPCMIQKSDGASLYGTTDLGDPSSGKRITIRIRSISCVVDKRQELHFAGGIPRC
ncbi:MAG: arginine--tRNA ligase [[Clostridium] scindens]